MKSGLELVVLLLKMSSSKEKASEVTDKAFAARDLLKDAKATISTNIDNMGGHIERAKLLSKDAVNIGTGGVRADVITSVMMTEMSTIVSGLSLLVIMQSQIYLFHKFC